MFSTKDPLRNWPLVPMAGDRALSRLSRVRNRQKVAAAARVGCVYVRVWSLLSHVQLFLTPEKSATDCRTPGFSLGGIS